MGDHQLDIFRSQTGFFEGFFCHVGQGANGDLEQFGTFHLNPPVRLLFSGLIKRLPQTGPNVEQLPQGTAGLDDSAEQALIVWLIFQHDGPGAITEQHAGRPVSPVDHGAQGVRANQQNTVILSAFEIAMGNRHAVHKPRTGCRNIKGGNIIHAQARLE